MSEIIQDEAKDLLKTKRKKKSKGGRPPIDLDLYLAKILPYLQKGFAVTTSCIFAGVPQQTVSYHMARNQKFLVEIKNAQQTMENLARSKILKELEKRGGVETAKWFLERKCKKEFGVRAEDNKIEVNFFTKLEELDDQANKSRKKELTPHPEKEEGGETI